VKQWTPREREELGLAIAADLKPIAEAGASPAMIGREYARRAVAALGENLDELAKLHAESERMRDIAIAVLDELACIAARISSKQCTHTPGVLCDRGSRCSYELGASR
jgi:hypothetical protein